MVKRKFQASFNGFHVDSHSGVRHHKTGEIRLQNKELAVLVHLVLNAGKLVTKDDLIQSVWGGSPTSDSSIARCISEIKSQLKAADSNADALIKMVYGKGYKFIGEVISSASFMCEESFSILINTSPDFILFKDGDGRWMEANRVALNTFDLADKEWRGKNDTEISQLLPPAYRATLNACTLSDSLAWEQKKPNRQLETVPLADGSNRHFDVLKSPLFNKDGSRNLLIIFGHDVTDLLRLMEQQKLNEQVLANSREAVMITDTENLIVSANRAFYALTGYTEEDVIGKTPGIFCSGGQHSYDSMWKQLKSEGVWRGEISNKRQNGEAYAKWLDISSVHDRNGVLSNYIAIFSDLTARTEVQHQIEFLAYHDSLTRLPNRVLLQDRFKQAHAAAMRENTMLAVLFLDLDKFKLINDTQGHETGDQLLRLVAQRLIKSVREVDTVSRIGGDEFVILLTDLRTTETVSAIAEKILSELSLPYRLEKTEITSSISIGIALYPNDGQDLETLLRMSDASMYHAKNCGRNTYRFFTTQMNIASCGAQRRICDNEI